MKEVRRKLEEKSEDLRRRRRRRRRRRKVTTKIYRCFSLEYKTLFTYP